MAPESHIVEWKSDWRDEYLKWICGFANAQGGTLEIGKNDRGEVVGVTGVLRLLEDIPIKVKSLLGILVDVNLKSASNLEYLEIVVAPHPNPISYKGAFYYRSGSTKQVLTGAALSRFLLERYGTTWDDAALPGIGLKDLDDRIIDVFREKAVSSGRLPRKVMTESVEGIIENLNLRHGPHLTRAAALLFHPAPKGLFPDAYIKIGYFQATELKFQDVIEGPLFTQVDRTMDLLYTKYTRGLVSYDGIYRVETFPVPREAMREAVINAITHRDYASPTPTQIRVSDDQIVIWNAAHLSPEWMAKLLAGETFSRPYNPRLAYAFFRAGMIEAWGRGIQHIIHLCHAADNPTPAWNVEAGNDGLYVRFPFSTAYKAADSDVPGGVTRNRSQEDSSVSTPHPDRVPENRQKTTRKQPENNQKIDALNHRILSLLSQNPFASRRELAATLGITESQVRYRLDKLRSGGKIARVGPDKGGQWTVLE